MVATLVFGVLGFLIGVVNTDAWALLSCMGAFGLSVMIVAQHYQHRTAILLYLATPRRILVLVGQRDPGGRPIGAVSVGRQFRGTRRAGHDRPDKPAG